MMSIKPFATISIAQWHANQSRGMTAMVANCPYIVTKDESTHDTSYQPVAILADGPPRRNS